MGMGRPFAFGAGLLGLAWWFLSRTLKRSAPAKIFSRSVPLTVREPDEISVLCYNVLADNLVRCIPNFKYANELYLSWEYRFVKLQETITTLRADVVCLQEIEMSKWNLWRDFMDNLGYTGVILKRPKRNGRHHSITNATFFRSRRFRLCWEKHCSRALGIALRWSKPDGQEQASSRLSFKTHSLFRNFTS